MTPKYKAERLRRMAAEIEKGALMCSAASPSLPEPDPARLGAFAGEVAGLLVPNSRAAMQKAAEDAIDDAKFLRWLASDLEGGR